MVTALYIVSAAYDHIVFAMEVVRAPYNYIVVVFEQFVFDLF